MPVTAEEAQQIVSNDMRRINGGERRLPTILPRLRRMMKEDVLFIANVGPWGRMLETGSLKGFIVPSYDPLKDKEGLGYARSADIPAVYRQAKISNDDEYGYIEDDGFQVAWEALGIGHSLPPGNAIVKMGFFVPALTDPRYPGRATPDEVAKAQEALSRHIDELIAEARDAYDKGPEERKAVISADRHLLAARLRGIDEPWVHHQHSQQNLRCPMCQNFNPANAIICKCGEVLDEDAYRERMARRKRIEQEIELEAATAPPKKK
jgi:hypothetical protein